MNADTNINDKLRLAASICGMQIQPAVEILATGSKPTSQAIHDNADVLLESTSKVL